MHVLRRRGGGHGPTLLAYPPVHGPDAVIRYRHHRTHGVRHHGALGDRGLQEGPPITQQIPETLGIQVLHQVLLFLAIMGVNEVAQGFQMGPQRLWQARLIGVEVEQIDVEIAHGPRELTDPAKGILVLLDHVRGKHILDLGEGGTGAAHGYAQVMEKFRVQVLARTRDIDLDGIPDDPACDLCVDPDNDLVCDPNDNCRWLENPGQEDDNGNLIGDACEADLDGDNVINDLDNCPDLPNPTQLDTDMDGQGDACDLCTDSDYDGAGDPNIVPVGAVRQCPVDNCPLIYNPEQIDSDNDAKGNACDFCPLDVGNDADIDGLCAPQDNCPNDFNVDQANIDGDDLGNACDLCPEDKNNDFDNDGICGDIDNCPVIFNPNQRDQDGNGLGDLCDEKDLIVVQPPVILPPIVPPPPRGPGGGPGPGPDSVPTPPPAPVPEDATKAPSPDVEVTMDGDGDGVMDDADNCAKISNPSQADSDENGVGNACEASPAAKDVGYDESVSSEESGTGCSQINSPAQSSNNLWFLLLVMLGALKVKLGRSRKNG